MILGGHPGKLVAMLGVVCSSWTIVNRGTAKRDMLVPYGQNCYLSVRRGNKMVARRYFMGTWFGVNHLYQIHVLNFATAFYFLLYDIGIGFH